MITEQQYWAWRQANAAQLKEVDLDASLLKLYTTKPNDKVAAAELAALNLIDAKLSSLGFKPVVLEEGHWFTIYDQIRCRVFVEHTKTIAKSGLKFTVVARQGQDTKQNNVVVGEWSCTVGGRQAVREPAELSQIVFDLATIVLPNKGE